MSLFNELYDGNFREATREMDINIEKREAFFEYLNEGRLLYLISRPANFSLAPHR